MLNVKYPVFMKCREWTFDPYWQNLLENFANGIFTDNVRLDTTGFFINNKKIGLTTDYKNNLLILKKELSKKEKQQTEEKTWKQIKSKNEKLSLITRFVGKCKREYGLSNSKCKELLSKIKLGLIFKIISNEDIDYRNNEIFGINGIDFEMGDYQINLADIVCKEIAESKPKPQNLIEKSIDRYIKEINTF